MDPSEQLYVFINLLQFLLSCRKNSYSPQELAAMILDKAKEIAADFAEQPIKDAVITVPPYFNQAERRALLQAAELAGLNVLQLMNDNAAGRQLCIQILQFKY